MTHPAATPPTAEQVETADIRALLESLKTGLGESSPVNDAYLGALEHVSFGLFQIEERQKETAALAPAERAAAVPDDPEALEFIKQGPRRRIAVRRETSTRAGALDAAGAEKASFLQGFGIAVANLARLFDQPGYAHDVISGAGFTIEDFETSGLEAYDLDVLRQVAPKAALAAGDGGSNG